MERDIVLNDHYKNYQWVPIRICQDYDDLSGKLGACQFQDTRLFEFISYRAQPVDCRKIAKEFCANRSLDVLGRREG